MVLASSNIPSTYQKYSKVDVFKKISKAYWDERNFPATGSEMKNWHNDF